MCSWRASRPELPWWIAALVLALPLIIVAGLTNLAFAPQTDEMKFHWEVVRQFGRTLPLIPWRDYHAATPPLPYVLWAYWGKAFGYELPALRSFTVIWSYIGLLAFWRLARARGRRWPLVATLLLLFSPYVFLNSFTLYTVNMGLVFGVLAIWLYSAEPLTVSRLIGGGLATTAAVYCRQHYLFLSAGMALWWIVERGRARRIHMRDVMHLALIGLPIGLFAPLAIGWGGLTPPAFQGLHPLVVRLEHVTFLLMWMGFYGAPVALVAWSAVIKWGKRALGLALGIPMYLAFRPAFEWKTSAFSDPGIILHGLSIVGGRVGPLAPAIAQFVLWLNGLVVAVTALAHDWRRREGFALKLWCWIVAFAAMISVFDYVGERFYALLAPVLILVLYPHIEGRRWAIGIWMAGSLVVSLAYAAVKMRGG